MSGGNSVATSKQPQRLRAILSQLRAKRETLSARDGFGGSWLCVAFGLTLIGLFSRSPSLFTHAQFYAEDGVIWFAQAYNGGWLHSLTLPQAGYLNTMPRLGAGLALLFPLRWAPLVMASVGILIQAVPIPILLSSRCRNWSPLPMRLLMAAFYVAIPNAREIHVVATNTQWHLALSAVLVAFATSPQSWLTRLFDSVLVLIASLSGPFCIVLTPLLFVFWWLRKQTWTLAVFALALVGAAAQVSLLLHDPHRVQRALHATPEAFIRILGGNVVSCALLGSYAFASMASLAVLAAAALVGVILVVYCLRLAPLEWKLFLVFCTGVFGGSLRSPLALGTKPAWDLLLVDNSARYWFFPMLAFAWGAMWCAVYARERLFKAAGISVLLLMPIGIIRDWRYPGFPDANYAASVAHMRDAKPGSHVTIPVVPEGWRMELVKKAS